MLLDNIDPATLQPLGEWDMRSSRCAAVLCTIVVLSGCTTTKPYDPATLRDLTPEERTILASLLSRQMKDPNAAQFRWGRIGPPNEVGRSYYCAMVNGKNSYGGYIGYQPFSTIVQFDGGKIAGIRLENTMFASDADSGSADVVKSVCHNFGLDPYSAT
jgi:hypothetical protein